jgi:hypothetical protein
VIENQVVVFTGLDQVDDLRDMGPHALVEAVNVVVGTGGVISTRPGYKKVSADLSIVAAHKDMILYSSGMLAKLPNYGELLGFVRGTQLVTTEVAGVTIVSTESDIGFMGPEFTPFPRVAQHRVYIGAGKKEASSYRIMVSIVKEYSDLEYSLPSEAEAFEVAEGGSLTVEVTDGIRTHVYLSAPDGEELYFYGVVTSSLKIVGKAYSVELIHPLGRQFLAPMPPGDIIASVLGYLVSTQGSSMCVSEPLDYRVYDPASSIFTFPDYITMVGVVGKSIYIGTTSELYHMSGSSPAEWALTCIHSMGVVARSEMTVRMRLPKDPSDSHCLVFTLNNGTTMAGFEGGSVRNLTEYEVLPGKLPINGVHLMDTIYYFTY